MPGLEINETADSTGPIFLSATLNLGRGQLKMVFNETIDTTTLAMVNLSKIFIGDLSTSFTNGVDAVL